MKRPKKSIAAQDSRALTGNSNYLMNNRAQELLSKVVTFVTFFLKKKPIDQTHRLFKAYCLFRFLIFHFFFFFFDFYRVSHFTRNSVYVRDLQNWCSSEPGDHNFFNFSTNLIVIQHVDGNNASFSAQKKSFEVQFTDSSFPLLFDCFYRYFEGPTS